VRIATTSSQVHWFGCKPRHIFMRKKRFKNNNQGEHSTSALTHLNKKSNYLLSMYSYFSSRNDAGEFDSGNRMVTTFDRHLRDTYWCPVQCNRPLAPIWRPAATRLIDNTLARIQSAPAYQPLFERPLKSSEVVRHSPQVHIFELNFVHDVLRLVTNARREPTPSTGKIRKEHAF
jgi:hypothetical protein